MKIKTENRIFLNKIDSFITKLFVKYGMVKENNVIYEIMLRCEFADDMSMFSYIREIHKQFKKVLLLREYYGEGLLIHGVAWEKLQQ